MTIEKISEIASPRLDDIVKKYEENGLSYSAGKFHIMYDDETHFQLAFEMYFQDIEGKWHKCADASDRLPATLLESGAWKKIKSLKVISGKILKLA